MSLHAPDTRTAFVFDLAGVLLQWEPLALYRDVFEGDEAAAQDFLARVMNESVQREISAGRPAAEVLREVAARHPAQRAAIEAWQTRWHEMLPGAIDGAVAVLGELRERGYRTFALGNWAREEFALAAARFDFLAGFDDVLLSGDCGMLKPDPGIFRLATQRFGLDPGRTVFIDDRADNAAAAVACGWNALIFEDPRRLYLVLMDYGLL